MLSIEGKELFFLHCQYHCCWWPSDWASVTMMCIGQVCLEYSGFSTRMVNIVYNSREVHIVSYGGWALMQILRHRMGYRWLNNSITFRQRIQHEKVGQLHIDCLDEQKVLNDVIYMHLIFVVLLYCRFFLWIIQSSISINSLLNVTPYSSGAEEKQEEKAEASSFGVIWWRRVEFISLLLTDKSTFRVKWDDFG